MNSYLYIGFLVWLFDIETRLKMVNKYKTKPYILLYKQYINLTSSDFINAA